ncbi:helix-turn-helix transcriptional regulator [Aureliella helgolandensis]|nr:LuxR C-terminal-related transcriptional regulator [Aureliella helgolandensis]
MTTSLVKCVEQLSKLVIEAGKRSESVAVVLETCEYCAYIKGPQGNLLAANSVYDRVFGNGRPVAGRSPEAFLDDSTLTISQASDQMIAGGCTLIVFDHVGNSATADGATRDGGGQSRIQYRTIKKSLQGLGIPGFACLGVTRVIGTLPPARNTRLGAAWKMFCSFPKRTQQLAVMLARGESQRVISKKLSISTRTLASQRAHVLQSLGVVNTHELSRLLVRVQDAGYEDLGL